MRSRSRMTRSRLPTLPPFGVAATFSVRFRGPYDLVRRDQFEKANHNPIVVLNGDRSKKVLSITAKGGSTVQLSAAGTSDPDKNAVKVSWGIYPEAGTLKADVSLSAVEGLSTNMSDVKKTVLCMSYCRRRTTAARTCGLTGEP